MRRILFDQNVPKPLAKVLESDSGLQVHTAFERGWSTAQDADLLTAAERDGYDVFVTCDRNLRFQQNLHARKLGVVILRTSRWKSIKDYGLPLVVAVQTASPGSCEEIGP